MPGQCFWLCSGRQPCTWRLDLPVSTSVLMTASLSSEYWYPARLSSLMPTWVPAANPTPRRFRTARLFLLLNLRIVEAIINVVINWVKLRNTAKPINHEQKRGGANQPRLYLVLSADKYVECLGFVKTAPRRWWNRMSHRCLRRDCPCGVVRRQKRNRCNCRRYRRTLCS